MSYASNAELLLASGRDAMSNLYDIYIIPPDNLGTEATLGTTAAMVVRAQDFTPPELDAEIYQNHYKTDHIDIPAPKLVGEKSFTIPYRIDASYAIHNALRKWKFASTMNTTTTDVDTVGALTYNGIWGAPDKVFGRVAVVAHKYADIVAENVDNAMDTHGYGIAAGLIAAAGSVGVNFVGWMFNNVWVEKVQEPSYTRDNAAALQGEATFRFTSMGLLGAGVSAISELSDIVDGADTDSL